MSVVNYVKVQEKFLPVNIEACGVKCFTCGAKCDPNRLEDHLSSHVDPQYNMPETAEKKPSKVNLSSLLSSENQKQTDLSVKSVLPDQIPTMENKKRNAKIPGGSREDIEHTLDSSDLIAYQSEKDELVSHLINEVEAPDEAEQAQIGFRKKVKFQSQKVTVNKRPIKLYENDKMQHKIFDHGGSDKRKQQIYEEPKKEYKIQKLNIYEETQQSSDRMNVSLYNITTKRKDPSTTAKITTFSSKDNNKVYHEEKMKYSNVFSYSPKEEDQRHREELMRKDQRRDHKDRDTESRHSDHHPGHQRLTCTSCKGFFCRECKSTIPAIYRPVPDQHGKYHLHPDAQAMQFYRKHYYGHNENICTNCEGLKLPQ